MATQTHADILKATPPEPAVPAGKQVTPPVTPLGEVAGRVAASIAASQAANGAAPSVATTPKETTSVPTTEKPAKTRDLDKLKNIFVHVENDAALKEAIAKAADTAQVSLAAWCKVVIAEKLGVAVEAPVKTAKSEAEKAIRAAERPDGKLVLMLLKRNHFTKLEDPRAAKEKAAIAKYIDELGKKDGVGPERAAAILAAAEKAVA